MAGKAHAAVERHLLAGTCACSICRKVAPPVVLETVPRDTPAYRPDGWPLCPGCGTDTLRSVRASERLKAQKLVEARQAVDEEFAERYGHAPWSEPVRKAFGDAWSNAAFRRPRPTDEMKCTSCRWSGCVGARSEQASGPARRGQ